MSEKRCIECGNLKVRAKGYCSKHYQQIIRHGKIMTHKENGYWSGKTCRAQGCGETKLRARGYCLKHYKYVREYGRPWKDEKSTSCKVSSCGESRCGFGYCLKHYNQYKKYGRIKRTHDYPKTCTVFNCDGKSYSRGLCGIHYRKYRRSVITKDETWRSVHLKIIQQNTKEITLMNIGEAERDKRLEEMVNLEIITEIMAEEPGNNYKEEHCG